MKLKPLGDRLVVKVLTQEEKTKGGSLSPIRSRRSPRKVKFLQ